jgi:hypothetical protein
MGIKSSPLPTFAASAFDHPSVIDIYFVLFSFFSRLYSAIFDINNVNMRESDL